jgi:Methionine aminopeptidase
MGQGIILQANQVIAIEPFATDGVGIVAEGHFAEIFGLVTVKPVRLPWERDMLNAVQAFDGLPFARRWLADMKRSEKAIDAMVRAGILHAYPVLIEQAGGMVSQAEHTLIVTEDGCEVTTR